MPYYVQRATIDWRYDERNAALVSIVAFANQRLSSRLHTAETFEATLRELAVRHPGLECNALIEDGFRTYQLFQVANRRVTRSRVEERPADRLETPVELPLEEMATVRPARDPVGMLEALLNAAVYPEDVDFEQDAIQLPIVYRDEDTLRSAMLEVADRINAAAELFVAEAQGVRYLVEVRPGTARVVPLAVVTQPELVGRLLTGQVARVPAAPFLYGL